jgi:polar amino acid transport system substrate-binding protein
MKNVLFILFVLLLSIIASITTIYIYPSVKSPISKSETAYERIIRTQSIQCGYVPFVPNVMKDPNTGQISGMDYEITEALGHKLGVKIVWTDEVGWATVVPGLKTGKYDAVCNADWVNPTEGREAYFSRPYYFQPLFVVTRADDTRFDKDIDAINDAGIKIASMDGDNPRFIAEEDFPKAQVFTLPDMSGMPQVFESVATGKADITFSDAYSLGDYVEHNPGKLKLTQLDHPVRIYPVGFVLPMGDERLRAMINTAMDELIYSGQIDKILKRYEKYPYSFISVERPHSLEHINPQ